MQILIIGGMGLIGCYFIFWLLILGYQVMVVMCNFDNVCQIFDFRVILWKGLVECEYFNEIDVIINLVGELIVDKCWML